MTFNRLAVTLLFLAIATAACLMPAQSDTFWQLRAGHDIVTTGRILLEDTFTHSVRGAYWPNHEWLSEVLFYGLHAVGGMPLLTAFAASMIVIAWVLVWQVMRGPALFRVVLILFVLVTSAQLWTIRPQVISLALLAILLVLVGRQRWRFVPLLMVAWANLHGGVMLGLAVLGGSMVVRVARDRRQLAPSLGTLAGSAAAVCLTPLGFSIWTEVPAMLQRLRMYDVQEWRPPSLWDPFNVPLFVAALALLVLAFRHWRALDDSGAMLVGGAVALLPLACKSARNVGPFLVVAAPALSVLLAESARVFERPERSARRGLGWTVACAAFAICVSTVLSAWTHPPARLNWRPVPAAVAHAIAQCPGNLYNQYDNGGYLVWFVPEAPVFMDSRQDPFPSELVLAHRTVETTGDYRGLFDRFGIGCAALPPWSPTAQRLRKSGWRVTAQGDGWIVLEESAPAPLASSPGAGAVAHRFDDQSGSS
jgi:hypothetical protein